MAGAPDPMRAEASETVLVVNDEPTIRMLVTDTLAEMGYASLQAGDSASGFAVLLVTDSCPAGIMTQLAVVHRIDEVIMFNPISGIPISGTTYPGTPRRARPNGRHDIVRPAGAYRPAECCDARRS